MAFKAGVSRGIALLWVAMTTAHPDDHQILDVLKALSDRHPIARRLIEAHGPFTPRRTLQPEVFRPLARSIIYQQLAGKAAASIHGRFEALFDGEPAADDVLREDPERIRQVGLSRAKRDAILALAEFSLSADGSIERLLSLDDDAQQKALCVVRGIGPWTAQMWQLFHLGRLDIWPTGDLGVRKGCQRAFEMEATPSAKDLMPVGEPFRPYRSVLAWYCWRAADAAP